MKYLLPALFLFLGGCASTLPTTQYTNTSAVIAAAAEAAPDGVAGEFVLPIKASGVRRGTVFLNTQLDYRDQRSITVAISPEVAAKLAEQHGQSPAEFFINKDIRVKGTARRVTIDLFCQGRLMNTYYYQTHIDVTSAAQIQLLN